MYERSRGCESGFPTESAPAKPEPVQAARPDGRGPPAE